MKIYIKNMFCESCKVVVKEALEELDIPSVKARLELLKKKRYVN